MFISDVYYGNEGCMTPVPGLPGFVTDNQDNQLPAVVRERERARQPGRQQLYCMQPQG